MQHMESLKREVEKLKAEAKQGSSGRMLEEVDKYRKANAALHATIARLEASPFATAFLLSAQGGIAWRRGCESADF